MGMDSIEAPTTPCERQWLVPVSLARFKWIDTRAATGRYHAIDAALQLSMAIERPIMPRNGSHYGIIAPK